MAFPLSRASFFTLPFSESDASALAFCALFYDPVTLAKMPESPIQFGKQCMIEAQEKLENRLYYRDPPFFYQMGYDQKTDVDLALISLH